MKIMTFCLSGENWGPAMNLVSVQSISGSKVATTTTQARWLVVIVAAVVVVAAAVQAVVTRQVVEHIFFRCTVVRRKAR